MSKGLLIQVVHSHSNHRNQRHIQKPYKLLRWSILRKQLTAFEILQKQLFLQHVPRQMLGKVLNMPLGIMGNYSNGLGKSWIFFVMLWESDEIFVSYILKNSTWLLLSALFGNVFVSISVRICFSMYQHFRKLLSCKDIIFYRRSKF